MRMLALPEGTSSQIKAFGYDPESKVLRVEFVGGSLYDYSDVTFIVIAEVFFSKDSIGKKFNEIVKKGGYKYVRVERTAEADSVEVTA